MSSKMSSTSSVRQHDAADDLEWDEDENIAGREKVPRKGALKYYNKLMLRAATPMRHKHLHYIKHFNDSKALPIGGISLRIYRDLVEARSFDELYRLVPKHEDTREGKIGKLASVFIAPEDDLEAQRILEANKLRTPIWRIGYKKFQHTPVGMAKHANNVLNSEGRDLNFSYDGDWKDGKMHGSGIYQFADGHRYEGTFKEGWMDGPATVTYPCKATFMGYYTAGKMTGEGTIVFELGDGHKYEGLWKNGKRHGKGVVKYKSGLTYEGDFFVGKFHGRGRIHSPSTGYTFEGYFEEGTIRGFGALYGPDGSKEVRFWGGLPPTRPFTGAIDQLYREKVEDFKFRMQQDDERFAYIRALRLQDFLSALRKQIAQDRFDKKREKMLDRRRKAKKLMEEMRARAETRRNEMEVAQRALAEGDEGGSADGQSSEGAGDWPGDPPSTDEPSTLTTPEEG